MDVFCSQLSLQTTQVCFTAFGKPVAPDDTAEKLMLEDGGTITAIIDD